jgi:hypothetical protein
MLVAFLWLTIGTSFIPDQQQKKSNNKITSKTEANNTENDCAPFENAKEEKPETNPKTFSEEYLREDTEHFSHTATPLKHIKRHFANAFVAYYGESASQPPETIFC